MQQKTRVAMAKPCRCGNQPVFIIGSNDELIDSFRFSGERGHVFDAQLHTDICSKVTCMVYLYHTIIIINLQSVAITDTESLILIVNEYTQTHICKLLLVVLCK
jgi:hypothetical protein